MEEINMYTLLDELFARDIPSSLNDMAVEIDNAYVISIEVPGVKREDITMDVDGNYLKIKAVKKNPFEKASKVILNSRSFRQFTKTYVIGDAIDKEAISAELKDGVLTVTLQKTNTKLNHKIEIR
jgi:HSP20 family protein